MKKFIILYILVLTVIVGFLQIRNYVDTESIRTLLEGSKEISFTGNTFVPNHTGATINSSGITNTGLISTGSQILTGGTLTELENFKRISENGFYRIYTPIAQPTVRGTYQEKSNILNNFITQNNFHFTTSNTISKGYLYIKTKRELKNDEDIFLFFYNTKLNGYPVSGKIVKEKNLLNSNKEFLFNLSSLWLYKYYDGSQMSYNWLDNELNSTRNIHFIAGYITTNFGNSIEEISIAGEY